MYTDTINTVVHFITHIKRPQKIKLDASECMKGAPRNAGGILKNISTITTYVLYLFS